jgi:hypothetical protein
VLFYHNITWENISNIIYISSWFFYFWTNFMFFESISRFIYVWLIWVKRVVCDVELWVDNCGGCAWCYAFSTFLIHFDTSVVKNFENPLNNLRSLPRTVQYLNFFLHWYLRPKAQTFPLRTNTPPPPPFSQFH